ncbi:hypothetical protein FOZ62_002042, partial [Perkinsus olseni]
MTKSSATLLHDGDRLIAVEDTDECATLYRGGLRGVPGSGISRGASGGVFPFGDISADGAPVQPLVQGPGTYKLCWCDGRASADCSDIQQFKIEAGRFAILGPLQTHEFNATVGTRPLCVTGVEGFGLQQGDLLAVVSSCGVAQGVRGIGSSRSVWQGISTPSVDGNAFCWDPLSVVAAVPGVYSLCWCSSRMACVDKGTPQFKALAGKIRVYGPYPDHDFGAVVRGARLSLTGITGVGLGREDRLAIMSECGDESTISGIPAGPASEHSLPGASSVSLDEGRSFYWGTEPVTATPGVYSVCWCGKGGSNSHTFSSCSSPSHFAAHAGSIEVVGPDPSQNRGLLLVRGTKGVIPRLWGRGFNVGDVFAVRRSGESCTNLTATRGPWETNIGSGGLSEAIDSDAMDSTRAFVGVVFRGRVLSQPGAYQLCWCSPVSGANCGAGRLEDFRALAGTLRVVGPEPGQVFACARGEAPCTINGFKSTQSTYRDRLLIVRLDETCGTDRIDVSQSIGESTHNGETFTWATEAAGGFMITAGSYRLCWCSGVLQAASAQTCRSSRDFTVDAGMLHVFDPYVCSPSTGSSCHLLLPSLMAYPTSNSGATSLTLIAATGLCSEADPPPLRVNLSETPDVGHGPLLNGSLTIKQ